MSSDQEYYDALKSTIDQGKVLRVQTSVRFRSALRGGVFSKVAMGLLALYVGMQIFGVLSFFVQILVVLIPVVLLFKLHLNPKFHEWTGLAWPFVRRLADELSNFVSMSRASVSQSVNNSVHPAGFPQFFRSNPTQTQPQQQPQQLPQQPQSLPQIPQLQPQPQPLPTQSQQSQWESLQSNVDSLVGMGWTDKAQVVQALIQSKGNINGAIQILVSESERM